MKISNKKELQNLFDQLQLSQISRDEISIVHENDHWNGPTEGVCKWKDKEYYFIWCGDMDKEKDEIIRKFLLINLIDDQMVEEKKEHSKFLESRNDGEKLQQFYKDQESFPEFKIDIDQLIGWFID